MTRLALAAALLFATAAHAETLRFESYSINMLYEFRSTYPGLSGGVNFETSTWSPATEVAEWLRVTAPPCATEWRPVVLGEKYHYDVVLEIDPLPDDTRVMVTDHEGHVIGLVLHGAEAAWECRP